MHVIFKVKRLAQDFNNLPDSKNIDITTGNHHSFL